MVSSGWLLASRRPSRQRFDDLVPLRSLTVESDIGALEDAAGAKVDSDGLIRIAELPWVRLLPAEQIDRTLVHVMIEKDRSPADRVAASRIAEAVRRQAEARRKEVA